MKPTFPCLQSLKKSVWGGRLLVNILFIFSGAWSREIFIDRESMNREDGRYEFVSDPSIGWPKQKAFIIFLIDYLSKIFLLNLKLFFNIYLFVCL